MNDVMVLLAQDGGGEAAGGAAVLVGLICYFGVIAAVGALQFWGVFKKAGEAPWLSMIPIVNLFILCKVAGKSAIWGLGFFVPLLNIVVLVIICLEIAKKFGKEPVWAVGLILLGIVFFPILGFGDAKYNAAA